MKPVRPFNKEEVISFLKKIDKKTWGSLAVNFVGIILAWIFFIEPAWFARPRMRDEMQKIDVQLKQFQTLGQKRPVWTDNEKAFSRIINETKARIYKEGESALLLGQVSRLADEARVDVMASKPIKATVSFPDPFQNIFNPVAYDFTLRGGYHSLGQLIAGIENYPKLLRIQSIQITGSNDSPEKSIAQLELVALCEPGPIEKKKTPPKKGAQGAKKK
jgi:hypothetical protein